MDDVNTSMGGEANQPTSTDVDLTLEGSRRSTAAPRVRYVINVRDTPKPVVINL